MANLTNLLNINVDKLFEQQSIAEIDQVHKRLQAEVELKREELRTMVGERYRDLLKAADTIGDMRTTASSIIQNVENITSACRKLNDHQLIGFRSGSDQQRVLRKNTNNKFHGVIVQIKLLTSLPEMIWSAIDDEDYFVATQLFIFSRHISTGLQLDSNSEMMAKFPVAKKQWAVLSQFFFTIKQNCASCLEREDLTPEVAAKCLASLLLLENCQLDHILSLFVQMRLKAYAGVLSENSRHGKVKDKILASLKLLMNTVNLMNECFIGSEQEHGLLIKELMLVTDEIALPTIHLIKSEDPKIIQTLPDIICKFRPRIVLQSLSPELVRKSSQLWLKNVEKIAISQLSNLMDLVTTIKVLHDIKKLSLEAACKPGEWSIICKKLSFPESLDFYVLFYQPLINSRIKAIIKKCWSEMVTSSSCDILNLLSSVAVDKSLRDVKSFVWSESSEDIPLNLKAALDRSNLATHYLLMKSKAFPPVLVNLASSLDERIQSLTKDVASFLETSATNETSQLIEFYSDCSVENINELLTAIKTRDYKQSPEKFILLARLLIAYRELCPSLKQCLTPSLMTQAEVTVPWQSEDKLTDGERWSNVSGLLEEESLRFWKLWLEQFVTKWPQLERQISYQTLLTEFPLWDTVTIEENDEQNQPVQSTIHVPALPSFPLQKLLHVIATLLNALVPQTIPKTIIVQVVERIISYLHDHYQFLSQNEFVRKNQNSALQYYFDLKFVQLLFSGRERKQLADPYNDLINEFKTYIDPFDFDVFYPHVNTNVKRAVQRMHHFFGILVANGDQLNSILGTAGSGAAVPIKLAGQDKNPNILALSSNSASETWFPLLPIVTKDSLTASAGAAPLEPVKATKPAEEMKPSKPPSKEPSASRTRETVSSSTVTAQNYAKGAAAFFGLDKDWFR
ncbi:conserved oligomeric Golgi complex subunit 1 [Ochlerotatus camptorhynchus]|uniref:conserved oligomeric Golgi complex subunit 1 n=1 Tax=Ochlerotatus camptorhynchus TaxID=644619 RepID=UPI0031D232A6